MRKSKGYWILTIIDLLTKWSIAAPSQDVTAKVAAKAQVDKVIKKYKCLKALFRDLNTQFQAKLMKAFAELFHIKRFKRKDYHLETQGIMERSYSNLVHFIRESVGKKEIGVII